MSKRLMLKEPNPRPDLEALLEQVRAYPPMTLAERRAQAISFVYGQLWDSPATEEEIAARYDEMYGKVEET